MKNKRIKRRKRLKQEQPLRARLLRAASEARNAANEFPPGRRRELILRKAREAEVIAYLEEWLSSPGLELPE
jgi:uncharacterized protein YqeY